MAESIGHNTLEVQACQRSGVVSGPRVVMEIRLMRIYLYRYSEKHLPVCCFFSTPAPLLVGVRNLLCKAPVQQTRQHMQKLTLD